MGIVGEGGVGSVREVVVNSSLHVKSNVTKSLLLTLSTLCCNDYFSNKIVNSSEKGGMFYLILSPFQPYLLIPHTVLCAQLEFSDWL